MARAGSLTPRPPPADLWPGIAPRLERSATVAPFQPRTASAPLLLHDAAARRGRARADGDVGRRGLGAASTAAARRTRRPWPPSRPAAMRWPRRRSPIRATTRRSPISSRRCSAGRADLDPGTVKILETNLDAIDKAIDQSRRALAADPANVYLNNHLADARQRKLALLRRATAMVNKRLMMLISGLLVALTLAQTPAPAPARPTRRRRGPDETVPVQTRHAALHQQLRRRSDHPHVGQGLGARRRAPPVADEGDHQAERRRAVHQTRRGTMGPQGSVRLRHHRAGVDADQGRRHLQLRHDGRRAGRGVRELRSAATSSSRAAPERSRRSRSKERSRSRGARQGQRQLGEREDPDHRSRAARSRPSPTNGAITMTGIDSKSVDASTVNGTIIYEGKPGRRRALQLRDPQRRSPARRAGKRQRDLHHPDLPREFPDRPAAAERQPRGHPARPARGDDARQRQRGREPGDVRRGDPGPAGDGHAAGAGASRTGPTLPRAAAAGGAQPWARRASWRRCDRSIRACASSNFSTS